MSDWDKFQAAAEEHGNNLEVAQYGVTMFGTRALHSLHGPETFKGDYPKLVLQACSTDLLTGKAYCFTNAFDVTFLKSVGFPPYKALTNIHDMKMTVTKVIAATQLQDKLSTALTLKSAPSRQMKI